MKQFGSSVKYVYTMVACKWNDISTINYVCRKSKFTVNKIGDDFVTLKLSSELSSYQLFHSHFSVLFIKRVATYKFTVYAVHIMYTCVRIVWSSSLSILWLNYIENKYAFIRILYIRSQQYNNPFLFLHAYTIIHAMISSNTNATIENVCIYNALRVK